MPTIKNMKKITLGKKVNQYKKTYNKELGVLLGLTMCFLVMSEGFLDRENEVYVKEVALTVTATVPETEYNTPKKEIENKIKHYFPRSWRDMIPVAYAESNLNHNAQNWNCYYNKDETIVYSTKVKGSHSTFCKKGHRAYAWSVDCGVMQLNVKGKVCPKESIDEHLKKAADLSKIQGKEAWVTYKEGKHLTYK